MTGELKYRTIDECVQVHPSLWSSHVATFRDQAREELRSALDTGVAEAAEHWRLFAEIVELDPRDWEPYGLLDRWGGDYDGSSGDCSSGCAHYRRLASELGADWGVCASPVSHRSGRLTFEHQGCPAFESENGA